MNMYIFHIQYTFQASHLTYRKILWLFSLKTHNKSSTGLYCFLTGVVVTQKIVLYFEHIQFIVNPKFIESLFSKMIGIEIILDVKSTLVALRIIYDATPRLAMNYQQNFLIGSNKFTG